MIFAAFWVIQSILMILNHHKAKRMDDYLAKINFKQQPSMIFSFLYQSLS